VPSLKEEPAFTFISIGNHHQPDDKAHTSSSGKKQDGIEKDTLYVHTDINVGMKPLKTMTH
jgi:hypothetical protein